MADMIDPLTAQLPPSRMCFEEDELESESMPPLPDVVFNWSPTAKSRLVDGKLNPKIVLVALSQAGALLLHHLIPAKKVAGSIMLPEISMQGNTVAPSPSDRSCLMHFATDSPDVLTISCQYDVSGSRSHAVVKSIFNHIQPSIVLVLASVPPSYIRTGVPPGSGIFTLQSDAYKAIRQSDDVHAQGPMFLPPGNIVDGLAAALLSHCQVRGMAASVLLGVQLGPRVDEAEVAWLANAVNVEVGKVSNVSIFESASALDAMKAAEDEWKRSSQAILFS